jgi:primosomal protein N' (replication factor Y)
MGTQIVDVLVPVALDQAYSYRVPPGIDVAPGDLVRVPLGTRAATGAVWGEGSARQGLDNRLREISEKLDVPPLRPELRRFVDWVADYTLSSRGMVLRMALRMGEHLATERPRMAVRLAGPPPARMTSARQRVLDVLADGLFRTRRDVAAESGVSPSVIDALIDEGTLEIAALPPEPVARRPDPEHACQELTTAQKEAVQALLASVSEQKYQTTLLDGVTGSGKTQVYFEALAEAIRQSRQTLVLLPEIALTAQFLDRFAQRFGCRPALWH